MPEADDLWVYTGIVVFLSLLWSRASRKRREAREATANYTTAAEALATHYDAMERLVADPATPPEAIQSLLSLSEISAEEKYAIQLAERLCSPEKHAGSKSAEFSKQMAELEATRPDLVDCFDTALANGIAALFLRWPSTSVLMPKFAARLKSRRAEAAIVHATAVQLRSSNSGHTTGLRVVHGT